MFSCLIQENVILGLALCSSKNCVSANLQSGKFEAINEAHTSMHTTILQCISTTFPLKMRKRSLCIWKPGVVAMQHYIQPATEREKASCLCRLCLHLQLQFNALMLHASKENEECGSMSEYFGRNITCPKGSNGFFVSHHLVKL